MRTPLWVKTVFGVMGLAAVVVVITTVTSCSAHSNPNAASSPGSTFTPGTVMTMANGQVMTMAPGQQDTTTPSAGNENTGTLSQQFLAYVAGSFGTVNWTSTVASVTETGGLRSATTELVKGSPLASIDGGQICAALSNWELNQTNQFTGVQVLAADGSVIVLRSTEDQTCGVK